MAIVTQLMVEERGAFIAKYQGRLQVKKGKEVLQQAPLIHLEQVIVLGKAVSFSSDALMACAEEGIPVHFLNELGKPYANLYAAGLTGTVKTRRAQLMTYYNEKGVQLAVAIAQAKVRNQAALLRYMAKYRKQTEPAIYQALRLLALEVEEPLARVGRLVQPEATVDEIREELMSLEALAAIKYWRGVRKAVNVGEDWPGRKTHRATDAVNSALNYGYGVLYGQVERAVVLAGLDPYAGFIHADRPGRPSLVLDFVEEFRQPVIDRTVFAMLNLGTTIKQDEQGLLVKETKETLVSKIFERLDKPEKYEGKRQPLRIIIQSQARHAATFLRGDRVDYEGFTVKW